MPYRVHSHHYKTWSLGGLYFKIRTGKIDTSPSYQRGIVWNIQKQKNLIQTFLEHYPVPSINLVRNANDGCLHPYECMDGKNRLESLRLFMSNNLTVTYFDYETDCDRTVNWDDFTEDEQDHFNDIEIQVCVFENLGPDLRQDYFRRIQNGCVLSQPEIIWSMETNPIVKLARGLRDKYLTELEVIWGTTNRYSDLNYLLNLIAMAVGESELASAGHSTAMTKWVRKFDDATDLDISTIRQVVSKIIVTMNLIVQRLTAYLHQRFRRVLILDITRLFVVVVNDPTLVAIGRIDVFAHGLHALAQDAVDGGDPLINEYYAVIRNGASSAHYSTKQIKTRFDLFKAFYGAE